MDWVWTWQDPVAIFLVLLSLYAAFRLRKASDGSCGQCAQSSQGCTSLPSSSLPTSSPSGTTVIPLSELSFSRPHTPKA